MSQPFRPWARPEHDPLESHEDRKRRIAARLSYIELLFLPIGAIERGEPEWLVEGLIPQGYLALLAGTPKAGKTCLATAIAIAVATGTEFAGRQAEQGAVLWIAGEESPTERDLIYKHSPLVDAATPIYTCFSPLGIDDDEGLSLLQQWVHHTDAKLIVVDPLLTCITRTDLTNSGRARKVLQPLKRFCDLHRVACLVLHHTKRSIDDAGSRRVADNDQLSATAAMNLVLRTQIERASYGAEVRKVVLTCEGRGLSHNRVFHLRSAGPLDFQSLDPIPVRRRKRAQMTDSERAILEALKDRPMDSEQLIVRTGIGASSARNAITKLRKQGKILVLQVEKRRRIYDLKRRARAARNSEISPAPLPTPDPTPPPIPNPTYGHSPQTMF